MISNLDEAIRALLKSADDVVFLLDRDLRFLECSPAWDSFSAANGGNGIAREEILGKNILEFIPDILRRFYEDKYRLAHHAGAWNKFDYHCSSPEKIRVFRMSLCSREDNLVVVNHLRLEEPCEVRPPLTPAQRKEYFSPSGFLTMCANCRKSRRDDGQDAWEWVPEFLNEPGLQVSHGLCPRCLSLLYGDVLAGHDSTG